MTNRKNGRQLPAKRIETPKCEVHDGDAPAVVRVTWNGELRWVCRVCLDGRGIRL